VRPEVRQRLAWARAIGDLSRSHPNARHSWDAVRNALRQADGVVASTAYAGLDLPLAGEHVVGLVPIACNPRTRLWEFYDLRSAWDGVRDPATLPIPSHDEAGNVAIGDDTGIVFVLLPGGRFRMGAQDDDPGAPNYDEHLVARAGRLAAELCGPVHEVSLAPFFLARHELTKGQWQRLWRGDDALLDSSEMKVGELAHGRPITLAHPVQQVDWRSCTELLAAHGLVLPTEAQWEYACRAGTEGAWSVDIGRFVEFANVADAAGKRAGMRWNFDPWDDGHIVTAPVGSYRPNPLGLHDMYGNVWEWCQDPYGDYSAPVAAGDGHRLYGNGSGDRILRGGGFADPSAIGTSYHRRHPVWTFRTEFVGLRAARRLVP
jgi:formylglycine-generating enzyme required for sulfatase activity